MRFISTARPQNAGRILSDYFGDYYSFYVVWFYSNVDPVAGGFLHAPQPVGRSSPDFDIGELHISHDLQLVDAAQILHPVSELKQMSPIHGQFELMVLTEDKNFKVFPSWERKERQLPFLITPELTQVRVPYKHCRLNARVQMESNVSGLTVSQIDSEAVRIDAHFPCYRYVLARAESIEDTAFVW